MVQSKWAMESAGAGPLCLSVRRLSYLGKVVNLVMEEVLCLDLEVLEVQADLQVTALAGRRLDERHVGTDGFEKGLLPAHSINICPDFNIRKLRF